MLKLSTCLLLVCSLLLPGVAWAKLWHIPNTGFSIELPEHWQPISDFQLKALTAIAVQAIKPENTYMAIREAVGLKGKGGLTLLIMPMPYESLGSTKERMWALRKHLPDIIGYALEHYEINSGLQSNNLKVYSKHALADGFMVSQSISILGITFRQVVSLRYTRNCLVVVLAQYPNTDKRSFSRTLLNIIANARIDPAQAL